MKGTVFTFLWLFTFLRCTVQDGVSLTFVGNGCCKGPVTLLKKINTASTTLASCQSACLANSLCVAADFKGTECSLYTGASSNGVIASCTTTDLTSFCYSKPGTLPPTPSHAWDLDTEIVSQYASGVDRPGNDLRSFAISDGGGLASCRRQCDLEPACVGWAFSLCGGDNTCWLKSSVANPVANGCRASGVKATLATETPCSGATGVCVSDGKIWTRIFSCQGGTFNIEPNADILKQLATRATQVRIYNPDGRYVQSRPGTYPIRNLRKGNSLSYLENGGQVNLATIQATWVGDPDLLPRMTNGCGQNNGIADQFYWACGNGQGLHLIKSVGVCEWVWDGRIGKPISIWIDGGFDFPDLGTKGLSVATGYSVRNFYTDNAAQFQGNSGSYVDLALTAAKAFTTPAFSVTFWSLRKPSDKGVCLFTDRTTGSHGQFFSIRQWPKSITLEIDFNGSPYISLPNTVDASDGKWHHIAAVIDPSSVVLVYLDGNVVARDTYKNVPFGDSWPLTLGKEPNDPDYGNFDGSMAGVQIYDVALSGAQVAVLAGTGGQESICKSTYILNSDRTACVPIGPSGPIGPTGPAGPPGKAGLAGPGGPAGYVGATGPQGAAGATGATGPKGERGDPGDAGVPGKVGPTGETGPAGKIGDIGPPGIPGIVPDANVVVVTGPPGATGPIGVPGFGGAAGALGVTGADGPQGAQGATGDTGVQGVTGPLGVVGSKGPTGAQGEKGPQGAKGDTGATGTTGVVGATGPLGPTGYPGAAGNNGAVGATGPVGGTGQAGTPGTDANYPDVEDKLIQILSDDVKSRIADDIPKPKDAKEYQVDDFQRKVRDKADKVIKSKILLAVQENLERVGVPNTLTKLRDEIWALKRRVAYTESVQEGDAAAHDLLDVLPGYQPESGLIQAKSQDTDVSMEKTEEQEPGASGREQNRSYEKVESVEKRKNSILEQHGSNLLSNE